ncbi:glutamate--tRNA ligase [Patescibacteria group bacterium]|nr:glutamate--tRNA ligase [Patescibacteria group bacterium]
MTPVVTRIAPSPTGFLHFGLARTALFSYLFARKHGGRYILRIEDTDVDRSKSEYREDIEAQLTWLGLVPDERFVQSENRERHTECLKALLASGRAYESEEPAKDDPSRTVRVIRLKNPGETVTFIDLIRGEITFDTTELGDFVIARSVTDPLYHLAVVVDDFDEGVTHIIRGDDHISNTPRHVLIQRSLGFTTPAYAHLPLILMPDRTKMSKRKHETAVKSFRERGFLPGALLNYLALLGWNPGTPQEFFSLPELIESFSLEKLHTSGAVFDETKLLWFNREYMRQMSPEAFWEHAEEYLSEETVAMLDTTNMWRDVVPLMRERASTFGEIRAADAAGEYRYFYTAPVLDPALLPWKGADPAGCAAHLMAVLALLEAHIGDWTHDAIKAILWDYADEHGRGQVLWPLRYALSGKDKSPDPFTIAGIIGRDETLRRITGALELVRGKH